MDLQVSSRRADQSKDPDQDPADDIYIQHRPAPVFTMNNLTSPISPLLSPTKARRDAAEAKDWADVSSWLATKYSPQPVPRFERNGETLRALLELIAVNEAADREVGLIQRAEEEELRRVEEADRSDVGPCRDMLGALEVSLNERGASALNDLAEASLLLGTLSPDPGVMGERIMELSKEKFEREQQFRRISDLQGQLEHEIETMKTNTEKIRSQVDEVAQEDMQQRTAQLNRETKQFTTKKVEYSERIAALERYTIESPNLSGLKIQEQLVKQAQARVKVLERQISEFHSLPPDLEAARGEYQRAVGELQDLRRRRDGSFQVMVER
jgi:HAUS augmin-like complex subunit 1